MKRIYFFLFSMLLILGLVPFTNVFAETQDNSNVNKEGVNQQLEGIMDMKKLINLFESDGDITNEKSSRLLQTHLTALEHFEKSANTEKVMKHLKSFKELINYLLEKGNMSEKAHYVLESNTQHLIETKKGKKDPIVVGYWVGGDKLDKYPADKLTHINYAFAYVTEEGTSAVNRRAVNDIHELNKYKEKYPHMQSFISIGGWGNNSKYFSSAAMTRESRAKFVQSTIDLFIKEYHFDGIDLDWEFPVKGGIDELEYSPRDKENLTLLAKEFRGALDELGEENNREYLLTAATPAGRYQNGGPYDPADSYDFWELSKYLDWIYVMTYDLVNGYSPITNFNTPMYPVENDPTPNDIKRWNNVSGAVEYYQLQGVPTNKLVLGTAFYGRSFKALHPETRGLYQEYEFQGPALTWNQIKRGNLLDPNWVEYWEPTAMVPWLFNKNTNMFLTYDNPRSIGIKAQFVHDHNLRGGMTWQIAQDDNQNTLLRALADPILESDGE